MTTATSTFTDLTGTPRAIWLKLEPPMLRARDIANALLLALSGSDREAMSDEDQKDALLNLAYEARNAINDAIREANHG
jgi:hypothetical protein